eukprot:GHRR01004798.1.p1 GENE.GHRR01004798.1~~GHRR01004798.1.p1  ORF type:complete len:237 (+),score=84.52 GHRR01004798.1:970-1680(+)
MSAPQNVQLLSAMHVTPEKYLQRCAIVSPAGEECVLMFNVTLQETSECQYGGSPLVTKKWMLHGVTGECTSEELPSHPSPSFPPEAIVEAQLAALRECRVASVFAHASPQNKAATGPVEQFAAMLAHNPAYSPLMGHLSAETIQRLQPTETTYMEVVRIMPSLLQGTPAAAANGAKGGTGSGSSTVGSNTATDTKYSHQQQQQRQQPTMLYMFILSRQSSCSAWANCWMTEAVRPL